MLKSPLFCHTCCVTSPSQAEGVKQGEMREGRALGQPEHPPEHFLSAQ